MIQLCNANNSVIYASNNSICKKQRYSWNSRIVEVLKKFRQPDIKTFHLDVKHLRYDLIFKLYRALNPQNLSTPTNTSVRYQSVSLDITRFMQHKSIPSLKKRFHEQFGYAPTIVKKNDATLLTCPYKAVPRAPAILPSSLLGKVISFLPGREALSAQQINSQFVEDAFVQEAFKENTNELATAFVRRMIKKRQDTAWGLPGSINSKRHTIVKLDCSHLPITAEQLHKVIELFPNLKTLSIAYCGLLTAEYMTHLTLCRHLEELNLNVTNIYDMYLRNLPLSLKKLHCVSCSYLTDNAFLHLANKHNLEELNVSDIGNITGAHFAALPVSLKKLECRLTSLTDEALAQLANKHNLEELNISNTSIEGTHFGDLPTSLKKLSCSNCMHLQGDMFSYLSNHQNLEELDISGAVMNGFPFSAPPASLKKVNNDNLSVFTDEDS